MTYEHQGRHSLPRPPMIKFRTWIHNFNLLHLKTKGAKFTWTNVGNWSRHSERRLDRSICNQDWLDMCSSIYFSTMIKTRYDHYPLLLDFNTFDSSFSTNIKFIKMWGMHKDRKYFISSCWKVRVIRCPMFVLNKML